MPNSKIICQNFILCLFFSMLLKISPFSLSQNSKFAIHIANLEFWDYDNMLAVTSMWQLNQNLII